MEGGRRKLVIPGGSGFLGGIVAGWFLARRWDVVELTRGNRPAHPGVACRGTVSRRALVRG